MPFEPQSPFRYENVSTHPSREFLIQLDSLLKPGVACTLHLFTFMLQTPAEGGLGQNFNAMPRANDLWRSVAQQLGISVTYML